MSPVIVHASLRQLLSVFVSGGYKSFLRKHQRGYVTKVIKIQYCNRNLPSSKAFIGDCKALTLSEISQILQEAKVYSRNV